MGTQQLASVIRDSFASGVAEASIYGTLSRLGYTPRQILEASLVAKHQTRLLLNRQLWRAK